MENSVNIQPFVLKLYYKDLEGVKKFLEAVDPEIKLPGYVAGKKGVQLL